MADILLSPRQRRFLKETCQLLERPADFPRDVWIQLLLAQRTYVTQEELGALCDLVKGDLVGTLRLLGQTHVIDAERLARALRGE